MPSVRYYNQTAPFWDFVASLEDQGSSHPFFARNAQQQGEDSSDNEQQHQPNPWTDGWAAGFPFGGPFAHRGRRHGPGHHGPGHHHRGPPPPPPADHEMPDPPERAPGDHDGEEGPSHPRGPPPPFSEEPPHHGPGPHGRHGSKHGPGSRGRCGGRARGGFGGHGGPRHPAFAAGGPMGGFGALADMFQSQLFGGETNDKDAATTEKESESFKPEVDVFDTTEGYTVHISLPGAKKEDVGVNWDAEKSELSIAGVIYRPGDEELLKTLALDERKVGVFERKVRLGSRANPAQVDIESISAKLEDGILRVEVPKLDAGYVEIKKVDIE